MAKLKDVSAFFIALAQDMAEMQMGDGMTNLRLQKMLYFAQGWSLARNKKLLFDEPFEAWPLGPVVRTCYEWYCGFGSGFLTAEMPPREAFTEEEYELLLDTWSALSEFSTYQLVTFSHTPGSPWDIIRNHSNSREIPVDGMASYFSAHPLPSIKDKLTNIPVVEPLYRKDGVPVFAAEEV